MPQCLATSMGLLGSLSSVLMNRTLLAFLLIVQLGCASLPLSVEVATRQLVIENPSGLSLQLHRVGGDSIDLGTSSHLQLELQADRYFVEADGVKYPAPLLADLIADGCALTMLIQSPPEVPQGFVYIPAGPTLIGDVIGVGTVDERPARIEGVRAFFMAETETTNAQYVEFLNGLRRCEEDWIDLGGPKCLIEENASGRFATESPDMPLITVSYQGALAYCRWKSEVTGAHYRLPTEVEWERMARGPQSTTYAYGDTYDPQLSNQASGILMKTKTFAPSDWGLYEVTGNAFEWTSTEQSPELLILKGGSYVLDGPFLRNSFRMWYRPLVQADDIGFRVLREVAP